MTNISKKPLAASVTKELFTQLADVFARADKKTAARLFSELLTEAEQIQLMKRLAIVLLLEKNQSTYRIAKLLHVSDATVRRIALTYDRGGYQEICHMYTKEAFNSREFWQTIEVLLRGGMPAYGKDRWKGFGFPDS